MSDWTGQVWSAQANSGGHGQAVTSRAAASVAAVTQQRLASEFPSRHAKDGCLKPGRQSDRDDWPSHLAESTQVGCSPSTAFHSLTWMHLVPLTHSKYPALFACVFPILLFFFLPLLALHLVRLPSPVSLSHLAGDVADQDQEKGSRKRKNTNKQGKKCEKSKQSRHHLLHPRGPAAVTLPSACLLFKGGCCGKAQQRQSR